MRSKGQPLLLLLAPQASADADIYEMKVPLKINETKLKHRQNIDASHNLAGALAM